MKIFGHQSRSRSPNLYSRSIYFQFRQYGNLGAGAILLVFAFSLTACGGGGDGDVGGGGESGGVVESTNNLSAKTLDILTLDPRIGYPLKVSVSIDAVEAEDDVGLAFFAFDKDRAIVRQITLGTAVISQVGAGTGTYEVDFDIPSTVETAGPYFFGVVVDAANTVAETDEADNDASTVITLSIDPVPNLFIENMETDRSAIELQEFSSYVIQSQLNVVNSDAGATLTWGVKGTEVPIEVETFAVLRLTRTAPSGDFILSQSRDALTIAPTPPGADTSNSHDVPLYLWNSDEKRYMNAYGVDTTITADPCPAFSVCDGPTLPIEWLPVGPIGKMMIPGVNGGADVPVTEFDRKSAHLDFYFPGKLAQEIGIAARGNFVLFSNPIVPPPDLSAQDIQALRSFMPSGLPNDVTAAFCVDIRPTDSNILEDSATDNEVCSPVALLLPALPPLPPVPVSPPAPPLYTNPSNPVSIDQLYQNKWGGSFFGFGLNFSASTSADNRGVILNAQGSVPIQVFGQNIEFMKLEGRAQVLPLSLRDKPPAGLTPGFSLSLSHQKVMLVSRSLTSGSFGPFDLSVSKGYQPTKPRIVTIGPVPVKLQGALTGNIGIQFQINLNKDLKAKFSADGFSTILDEDVLSADGLSFITSPFINAEASASASVTVFLADVGVEGVVTLLEEKINIVSGASINVKDSRHIDGKTSEIVIVPRLRVINELTGISGALNVFVSVEIVTVEECSWGFITGYCPATASLKYPLNLLSYTGWKKADVLIDRSRLIDIVTLPDGTVNYYQ